MHDTPAARPWRVLFTPRWISWHLFAVAAVVGMTWLGDWQLRRALGGNILSWAYTFEWPLFAIFGVVFWVKTVRDELAGDQAPGADEAEPISLPAGATARAAAAATAGLGLDDPASQEPADIELAEYNAYLARLSKEASGHGKWHGLR